MSQPTRAMASAPQPPPSSPEHRLALLTELLSGKEHRRSLLEQIDWIVIGSALLALLLLIEALHAVFGAPAA